MQSRRHPTSDICRYTSPKSVVHEVRAEGRFRTSHGACTRVRRASVGNAQLTDPTLKNTSDGQFSDTTAATLLGAVSWVAPGRTALALSTLHRQPHAPTASTRRARPRTASRDPSSTNPKNRSEAPRTSISSAHPLTAGTSKSGSKRQGTALRLIARGDPHKLYGANTISDRGEASPGSMANTTLHVNTGQGAVAKAP